MKTHPLKALCLISVFALVLCQLALMIELQHPYRHIIAIVLVIPLLTPIKGMLKDQRYTYKWVGFLTLFYFSVGISEGFASPDNRIYSVLTTVLSVFLFIGSIYYSRYLRVAKN